MARIGGKLTRSVIKDETKRLVVILEQQSSLPVQQRLMQPRVDVGESVRVKVGEAVGEEVVGEEVGPLVGAFVGALVVGAWLGEEVVGACVGLPGVTVGFGVVGAKVGDFVGDTVGDLVGEVVGDDVNGTKQISKPSYWRLVSDFQDTVSPASITSPLGAPLESAPQ